jgi:hypothetical protein
MCSVLQETLKDVPLPEGEEPDPEFPVLEYPAGTWTNRSEVWRGLQAM